ncbi:hypothetical protein SASPL_147331 [Salvia splendens]|uniref:Epidermal patterning factor-like protein n=1 Tax=Salvia splendens TaxID=180675 RepID=A0A8X8Z620_SALSN|nr:hypothetical protein SASPL_147331 [Salvia splendens]
MNQLALFAAVTTLLFLASASALTFGEEAVGVGPGSSPPSCRSKCGPCTPCEAVHVVIHPGFTSKLEYYPEAWRCKCRDKIFFP